MSEIQNVIALTKLHIKQHYKESEWLYTDLESLDYYKSFVQKHRGSANSKPKAPIAPPPIIKKAPRPKPAPIKEVQKKSMEPENKPANPKNIERQMPKPVAQVEFSDFRKILNEYYPSQKILENQPDDTKAKEIAHRFEKANIPPEIIIIDTGYSPSEKLFLENVARALEARFSRAAVLATDEWDKNLSLRLVVGTQDAVNGISQPKVVMKPVDHYLQNPKEKAKLWQDLKSTLQSS